MHSSAFLRNSHGPPAPCGVRCLFWAVLSQVNGKIKAQQQLFLQCFLTSSISSLCLRLPRPIFSAISAPALYKMENPPFLLFVMGLSYW